MAPIYPIRFVLISRTGVRVHLEDDPVDDAIFKSVHGGDAWLYFPRIHGAEPQGLVVDIGAHHGIYAMEALRRYPLCRVLAIEPDPDACRAIQSNARLNDVESRIDVVYAGVAAVEGTGRIAVDPNGSWGNKTERDPHGRVPLQTMQTILSGRTPTIVKCNAEGAEFVVVPQLLALDARPRLIVLMTHPEAGSSHELVSQLSAAGYDVRDADMPALGVRFHCFWRGRSSSIST